jgi:hypothetical protein
MRRAAQRLVMGHRHIATGAAQARGPYCEVARLAELRVPGQARRDVDDALIARLTHGGSLFLARFACHVSTCRTLLAVLGSDDPRSRVAGAGLSHPPVRHLDILK